MRGVIMATIAAMLTLVTACGMQVSGGGGEPGMIGYVVDKENGRILVVSEESEDFSQTGGLAEFYSAISFSNAPDHVQIGDKVAVWHGAVAESYPGQSKVERLTVLNPEKPEGADLAQEEALRRALGATTWSGGAAVRSIRYDATADAWLVELKELLGEQADTLHIEDRR